MLTRLRFLQQLPTGGTHGAKLRRRQLRCRSALTYPTWSICRSECFSRTFDCCDGPTRSIPCFRPFFIRDSNIAFRSLNPRITGSCHIITRLQRSRQLAASPQLLLMDLRFARLSIQARSIEKDFETLHKLPPAMLINGEKFACEACVKGHRVSSCDHQGSIANLFTQSL